MHKLLKRQVKKLKIRAKDGTFPIESLLDIISDTYEEHDQERRLKDQLVVVLTEELTNLNKKIKEDAENYVTSIMENVVDGILTFDAEGQIQSVNSSAQKIFGFSEGEIKGENLEVLFPQKKDDQKETFREVIHSIRSGQHGSYSEEVIAKKQDDSAFPIDLSISRMAGSDTFICIIKDITTRITFQKELIEAKDKAEAAAIAKMNFLSTMSHEIRTPMNAVIGLTNLLIQDEPRSDQLENLNILKFSGENLLVLINDILDFNKIEAGHVDFERIDFSLKTLASSIKEALGIAAKEKGIGLRISIDSSLPEVIVGDPTKLSQILNNLIGNAVKFTDEGKVTVNLALQSEDAENVLIDFEVHDTGIGIPQDKIANVFESFTQSNTTITRKYGGTGLGLAITKRLVELMGGSVSLTSEVGVGSTFAFSLRFKKSTRKRLGSNNKRAKNSLLEKSLSGIKILLVEDNKVNQMVASKFLSHWGVDSDLAETGVEATEMVLAKDYDLVLMDLHMPEMDGFTATKIIRSYQDDKFKTLPIIALTASILESSAQEVSEAGMTDFVTKPFKPEDLNQKIAAYTLLAKQKAKVHKQ